jgi:hypothetical protein
LAWSVDVISSPVGVELQARKAELDRVLGDRRRPRWGSGRTTRPTSPAEGGSQDLEGGEGLADGEVDPAAGYQGDGATEPASAARESAKPSQRSRQASLGLFVERLVAFGHGSHAVVALDHRLAGLGDGHEIYDRGLGAGMSGRGHISSTGASINTGGKEISESFPPRIDKGARIGGDGKNHP